MPAERLVAAFQSTACDQHQALQSNPCAQEALALPVVLCLFCTIEIFELGATAVLSQLQTKRMLNG